jgi:DNA-binding CsgD family transcriptional regulator
VVEGTPSLIGRSAIVERIVGLLDGGRGVVVEGPAGIGKTSVLREAVRLVEGGGNYSIVRVSATLASQPIPLGALAGHLVGAPPRADDLARVEEAIIDRAGGADILIAIDDGHLLDDYSAVAIHQLVANARARVLASARSGAPASTAFAALVDTESCLRLTLDPLSEAMVNSMVTAQLHGPIDTRLAREAWAASQGNPMAVSLIVESAVHTGVIVRNHGLWTLSRPLAADPRLLELILDQLQHLSGPERSAVEVIALAEPLEAVIVSRLVHPSVISSLRHLGMVVGSESDADTQLRLIHPLFGEAVRQTITEAQRQTAISALAESLNVSHESEADMLLRVAVWGTAAKSRLDPDLLVRAAAVARTRSTESSIRLLRAALDAGAPASVSLDLAMMLTFAGRNDEATDVLAGLDTGVLTPIERASGTATRALGLIWTIQRPDVALALLDEERSVGGSDSVIPDLLDAIEAVAHLVKGDVGSAERIGSEVLSRTGIDAEAAVHAATASTVALGYSGRTIAALAVARRWAPSGVQLKTSNLPLSAGLTAAYWEMLELDGDLATLTSEAERARHSAIEQGDDMTATRAAKTLARSALLGGRPRRSSRLMRECLVALDGFDRMFISWCQCLLAEAQALAGEGTEARRTLDQSDEQGPVAPIFAVYRTLAGAAVAASEGHVAKAAEIAANGALEATSHGMTGQAFRCWYDALRLGHPAAAEELVRLASVDGQLAVVCREHARGALARNGDVLDRVAKDFTALGVRLYAAESGMSAAAEHLRNGLPTKATMSAEYAHSLLDLSDPVVTPTLQSAPSVVATLTAREREVARLAAFGLSDRRIAEDLHLSVRTVESHLARVYSKLGLHGRTDLGSVFAGSPAG